MEKLIPLISKL
jgi:GTP-binding protein EngB required for normal cell division